MPQTVHVFSGDEAATRYREAGGDAPAVVWREALIAGPLGAPPGSARWLEERATFLAAYSGASREACQASLATQERELEAAMDADEVVLWFARDLFCELSLLYVLTRVALRRRRTARLLLVQPADSGTREFPCFGALTPAALHGLLDGRRPIGDAELAAAEAAWEAVSAPSPERLDALASGGGAFADPARRQRARFPALGDGLGVTERAALQALGDTPRSLAAVLSVVGAACPGYGWTDIQVATELAVLARGPRPLVVWTVEGFSITVAGRAVLFEGADRVRLAAVNGWIGGVCLTRDALWRYDAGAACLHAPA